MQIYRYLGILIVSTGLFWFLAAAPAVPADELPPRPTVALTPTATAVPVPPVSAQGGLIWLRIESATTPQTRLWTRCRSRSVFHRDWNEEYFYGFHYL